MSALADQPNLELVPDYYSDDHLWSILGIAAYVKETGDTSFLDEVIPYYEKDKRSSPVDKDGNPLHSSSGLDHAKRGLAFTRADIGAHGLPLLGFADWNDTVNLSAGAESLFTANLYGKALLATAVNRLGARLMGISTIMAGKLSFLLAAAIGAFSGILIAPITTIYYDTGFLIGLKGFVAAIIGGLASYPIAAAGAVLVGLLEAFSSFYASAFKEVILFSLIDPVLLWRSPPSRYVAQADSRRRAPRWSSSLSCSGWRRWCWPSSMSPCSITSGSIRSSPWGWCC